MLYRIVSGIRVQLFNRGLRDARRGIGILDWILIVYRSPVGAAVAAAPSIADNSYTPWRIEGCLRNICIRNTGPPTPSSARRDPRNMGLFLSFPGVKFEWL